jgi:hypothetical protein
LQNRGNLLIIGVTGTDTTHKHDGVVQLVTARAQHTQVSYRARKPAASQRQRSHRTRAADGAAKPRAQGSCDEASPACRPHQGSAAARPARGGGAAAAWCATNSVSHLGLHGEVRRRRSRAQSHRRRRAETAQVGTGYGLWACGGRRGWASEQTCSVPMTCKDINVN